SRTGLAANSLRAPKTDWCLVQGMSNRRREAGFFRSGLSCCRTEGAREAASNTPSPGNVLLESYGLPVRTADQFPRALVQGGSEAGCAFTCESIAISALVLLACLAVQICL